MRQFYLRYKDRIWQTPFAELKIEKWQTLFAELDNENERLNYEKETYR